ncbi:MULTISPECIES: hypothetical protein [unclassified Variovorax]|uniref:hypothetical protein n=1 Tax=unclassified Variovorax TaxID=663243 RepID=UPI00076D24D4|nr:MULTISPECIES: hypothetical protein [unclassified Variovorax]KWT98191.1 hypothetical protein APY03_0862 [Variovorax sp. WDL1]PNG50318.1 hypothetical protein CHC06_05941 [Variovorax sp. B2]PNG51191.1 hypothetical protein CHC07_05847 [Variovorax sp. B4]VTV17411.1 hypothetical protein WDL1P1_00368 [Variovorax sp. WDL1]
MDTNHIPAPILADELMATLAFAPNGHANLTLISSKLASTFSPEEVSRALREKIENGTLGFEYVGNFHESQGLAFFIASEAKGATPTANAAEVLDVLVSLLRSRSDGRGDDWHQATWDELHKTLGKSYSEDAIVDGLRLGILDGLLTCAPRVVIDPARSPDYIPFYLAQHLTQTVLAFDNVARQVFCCHVRAGTSAAATRKVRASSYGGDKLVILGVCPGRQPFEAPEGGHLLIEKL